MTNRMDLAKRVARFVIAAGVNTLFGWLVYSLLYWVGLDVWLALLIATVCGVAFNFMTLGGYVFRQLDARRLPRFVVVYLVVYLVNVACVHGLARPQWSPIWVQFVLAPWMGALSYLLMSRLVFAGVKTNDEVASADR